MVADLRYKCRCDRGFTGMHCDVGKFRMFCVAYTDMCSVIPLEVLRLYLWKSYVTCDK